MTDSPLSNLHIALLHWPVLNRGGEVIATATTNLDVHDIARAARTYGVAGYWIVQPLAQQRSMVERIVGHWVEGHGAVVHPNRPEALELVHVVERLGQIEAVLGTTPRWVVTSAQRTRRTVTINEFAGSLGRVDQPTVLCFGTGWGMAPQVIAAADALLEPIEATAWNHLSVRSAVSIYLDRIWNAAVAG